MVHDLCAHHADHLSVPRGWECRDVRAVATSGSRDAKNSAEFFASVKSDFGISVRVISGEEEANLSFRGAKGNLDPAVLFGVRYKTSTVNGADVRITTGAGTYALALPGTSGAWADLLTGAGALLDASYSEGEASTDG